MFLIPDSGKNAGLDSIERELADFLLSKKKRITAYPKATNLVCVTKSEKDAAVLGFALKRHRSSIISSSLYTSGDYFLCLRLLTKDALKILPDICEHSERVYIGYDYPSIIKEHTKAVIPFSAVEKLCP